MSKIVLPLAAVGFCCFCVYMGGLASLQAQCYDTDATDKMDAFGTHLLGGVSGFSASLLSCSKVYRFYWFIMSYEFAIIAGLVLAVVSGKLGEMKTSFLGLFAIGTLLYIQASNAFLTVQSVYYYQYDQQEHRIRTTVAGAIMTAVINCAMVFLLGMNEEICTPAAKEAEKPAEAAKEVESAV